MKSGRIKNLALSALGAAIIAVCAFLTVPFTVPFTLQNFALLLILFSLGGRIGLASVSVYIALGLIGVPIFSGFSAGFSVIIGPTGGFIIGFAVASAVYLILENKLKSKLLLGVLVLLINYACGLFGYILWSEVGIVTSIAVCILPYIIPDCAKLALAYLISRKLHRLN